MDKEVTSIGGFPITLGFILNILVTLTVVIIAFATIRNDTVRALDEITKQERIIAGQQDAIMDLRLTIQKISVDQDYFHKQYNEDMNRYIRERPKQ